MYKFYLRYDYDGEQKIIEFPLAPEKLFTRINGCNKIIDTIGLGEVNLIKNIGLRDLEFRVFLPKDSNYFGMENISSQSHPPIFYLHALREIMENKCIASFIVERELPDGSRIFDGNMKVSIESYCVDENAGEEGCFWVNIRIKEYRDFKPVVYESIGEINGDIAAVELNQRDSKSPSKSYEVKKGDSLWKIAKLQLNDGSRYKEIAELNNIANPNKISVGTVLMLP